MNQTLLSASVWVAVGVPLSGAVVLSLLNWAGLASHEKVSSRIVAFVFSLSLLATLVAVAGSSSSGGQPLVVPLGSWFRLGDYDFRLELVADRLSLPFAAFSAALVGLIGAFSARYLHREPGFARFYVLLAWFGAGVVWVSYANSLDLMFLGWEIIGITSALLIGFFDYREGPIRNGLRAFATYRVCDISFLAAIVWLHHGHGTSQLQAGDPWHTLTAAEGASSAVAVLLVVASLGKAAMVPVGGWLPRAMEGPTPSSAVFYGALSVHLGPLLMLRSGALLEQSLPAQATLVILGVATALHGTFVGRAQTDIKSVLAYASMTQVGLIMAEIGLGLRYLALAHILGHAALRTLQILRSPNILHDHHHLERAMGSHVPHLGAHLERLVPKKLQPWLYRHALERGYFDALLVDYFVAPLRAVVLWVERVDERWLDWLSGHGPPLDAESKGDEEPVVGRVRGGR